MSAGEWHEGAGITVVGMDDEGQEVLGRQWQESEVTMWHRTGDGTVASTSSW